MSSIERTPSRTEPLTEIEKDRLRMVWCVLMLGVAQHDVASIFSTNAGRVAEAVTAVRKALKDA